MERPLEDLYEAEIDEIERSLVEWRNFDETKLYSDCDYSGFSAISEDGKGKETLDQAAVGESDEEYIFMSRSIDDALECERDKVQVLYAEEEMSKTLL